MRAQYEVERRFLVTDHRVLTGSSGEEVIQAYLYAQDGYAIRVRRTHRPTTADGHHRYEEGPAFLTAKGPRIDGARQEYELEIPPAYAMELIRRSSAKVSKTRYQLDEGGQLWDVDLFHGANEGLLIAECEGPRATPLRVPAWCGAEVTDDRRYDNENLASTPYGSWS